MSHLLLSIVGNTPQVVTETLYAVHQQGKPWPNQILVITTTLGKKGALRLIQENILEKLCNELGVTCPAFCEEDILIIPDAQGNLVADARTIADHEALANFIVTQVRDLTDDAVSKNAGRSIHASLAGGRKTMTFYLGYAMSLFGRPDDSLSHVLISPEFENHPDFFYPTRSGQTLTTREGKVINPADAIVELADIPFIRHRSNLPAHLKSNKHSNVNLRELIGWINLGENTPSIRLQVHTTLREIHVSDHAETIHAVFKPGVLDFAFYRLMAECTLNEEKDIVRPKEKMTDKLLAKMVCDELLLIHNLAPCNDLDSSLKTLENWNELQGDLKEKSLDSLKRGVSYSWFDMRINTLKNMFNDRLPESVTNMLLPRPIWKVRIPLKDGKSKIERGYGLPLIKENITIF